MILFVGRRLSRCCHLATSLLPDQSDLVVAASTFEMPLRLSPDSEACPEQGRSALQPIMRYDAEKVMDPVFGSLRNGVDQGPAVVQGWIESGLRDDGLRRQLECGLGMAPDMGRGWRFLHNRSAFVTVVVLGAMVTGVIRVGHRRRELGVRYSAPCPFSPPVRCWY